MDHASKVPLHTTKLKWTPSKTVAVFGGADNCAYYNHQNFVRDGKASHFLSTINWYQRFFPDAPQHQMGMEDENFPSRFEENVPKLRYVKMVANSNSRIAN